MALYPEATQRIIPGFTNPMPKVKRIGLHTAVSNSADIYGHFVKSLTPSHFYLDKNGGVIQYIDTAFQAAADLDGNGHTLSLEAWDGYGSSFYPVGGEVPAYNEAQIKGLVALIVWIYQVHPEISLTMATDSVPGPTSDGISWHRLGVPYRTTTEKANDRIATGYKNGYLKKGGVWYSRVSGKTCPGDAKIAQVPEIFAAVVELLGSEVSPPLPSPPAPAKYTVAYITEIQGFLNQLGSNLVVDGDFGAYTKTAVSKFQESHNLYVDGEPGPLTYAKLKETIATKEASVSAVVRNIDPYPGRVTSHFSTRRKNPATGKWSAHLGVDIAPVPGGTRNRPVRAFQAGTVVSAGWNVLAGRSGNGVIVDHGGGFRTYYGHLDRVSVKRGQKVSAGTTLGVGGRTGNVTGVHLHFETHYLRSGKWVAVNPFVDAKKYGITLGAGSAAGQVTTSPGGNANDRNIQTVLKNLGFYGGIVDGVAGNIQKDAVKAFQAVTGLVADGEWGALTQAKFEALGRPSTRAALNAALNPGQSGTQDNRNIQTALKNMGLYNGVIDGIAGSMQKSAVSEFQRLTGLVADGDWGSLTQAKFEALGRPGSRGALDAALAPPAQVLKRGSVSPQVAQMQQALKNKHYTKQVVDHQFGPQTDANIKDFQRRNGLVVDGIVSVGGPTWRALGL